MEFSYSAYIQLLDYIKECGYCIKSYDNYDTDNKSLILRHDVDFSIDKALKMAELEYSKGIKSTYFLFMSTDFYNILSPVNSKKVNHICELGHDIGLHFDETKYDVTDITAPIYDEVKGMEHLTHKKVKAISMHRPSQRTLEANYHFVDFVNTYEDAFFKNVVYISDSRMNWKRDPFKWISKEKNDLIQLLVHPFWYNERPMSIKDCLKTFIDQASLERYSALEDNITDLAGIMG